MLAVQLNIMHQIIKNTISLIIKVSAIFLFSLGAFFLIKGQVYPEDKLGPLPWGDVILFICIAAVSAFALYLSPNTKNYKVIYKILIGITILPYFIVFMANSFDCYTSLFQNRYRDGLLYISSLSIGAVSCLLGIVALIFNKEKNT